MKTNTEQWKINVTVTPTKIGQQSRLTVGKRGKTLVCV